MLIEYLATDYPDCFTTLVYTMEYASRWEIMPTSEAVFEVPSGITIDTIVRQLQGYLVASGIPFEIEPKNIDEKTEYVKFKYNPTEGPLSKYFSDTFIPFLYSVLGALIKQTNAKQVMGSPVD